MKNDVKIKKAFLKITKQYIANENNINSAQDINNGLCEEITNDVLEDVGCDDVVFEMNSEWFELWSSDDAEPDKTYYLKVWDLENMKKYGSIPTFPKKQLRDLTLLGHIWVYYNGKHYDAETPSGVKSFWDLPIYKRLLCAVVSDAPLP